MVTAATDLISDSVWVANYQDTVTRIDLIATDAAGAATTRTAKT
jgi:hypothetical protein